jgi:F-type H+-transporting ATPase subunit delta
MGLISKRYAKAIYAYAVQRGEEDAFYQRMQTLMRNLRAIPLLRETLCNPVVSLTEKAQLLEEAAGKRPEQSYLDFVRLVLTNRREKSLQQIALSYLTLYREQKNISVIHLVSAGEIHPDMLSRIQEDVVKRTHGKVEFSNHIDPSLEGGFIFQWDDLRLDASLSNQLLQVRKQFLQQNKTIL